ncbi:unnamed protein product, partial [Didymodactylos carnosus]
MGNACTRTNTVAARPGRAVNQMVTSNSVNPYDANQINANKATQHPPWQDVRVDDYSRTSSPTSPRRQIYRSGQRSPPPTEHTGRAAKSNEPLTTVKSSFSLNRNVESYSHIWKDAQFVFKEQTDVTEKTRTIKLESNTDEKQDKKDYKVDKGNVHVESTVDSKITTLANISTKEKQTLLMTALSETQIKLDTDVKRRQEQISTETKSVVNHILNDTLTDEQRLAEYIRIKQTEYEDDYNKQIQKYSEEL